MKFTPKTTLAAAAFAGLLAGSAQAAIGSSSTASDHGSKVTTMGDDKTTTHSCKGKNACKGKGGCKGSDNGCKGKNTCKGKGGCATDGSGH